MVAPPRIGILGFGEVGSSFARGFLGDGVADVAAYDAPPGPVERSLALRRASDFGVLLSFDPAILADRDIVFASVTQDAAEAAAQAVAPVLSDAAIYADVNSLGPTAKAAVAAIVGASAVPFVDIAIMGTPVSGLHRVPMLAAGGAAETLAARLAPFGTDIRVVGDRPGQAATVKILRSVLTKGLEVLLVEAIVAARRHDLDEVVVASFCELFERRPARELVDFLLRSHVVHAGRRALEVAQSVETVAEAGLDPVMSRAVAGRLEDLAALDLKTLLGGEQPATWARAVDHLDAALGRTGEARSVHLA